MDLILFDTPLGEIGLAEEDGAVVRLYLPGIGVPRIAVHETPLLAEGRRQLEEYFAGQRREFDLPLAPEGTPFQKKCWDALEEIPYGTVATYREQAQRVGCPKGFRAVGMANHRNPIPILIPCHRVVGSDGSLTGYASGLEHKRVLLALEGVPMTDRGRVNLSRA